MFSKIIKLLRNPKEEYKNIIPYLKSRIFHYKKMLFELFGIDTLSKPYPGHDRLLEHINWTKGFFVQGGGNDGFFQDPTYYLEKFKGWTGVIVEPLSSFDKCRKARTRSEVYNYALVSNQFKEKTITLMDCNAMSVVKGSFEGVEEWVKKGEIAQNIRSKEVIVPARTLDSILEDFFSKHGKRDIDLLVLDLEGYELEALKGLDIRKYAPKHLLLEVHGEKNRNDIESYLGKGYEMVGKIGDHDLLYRLI